MTKHQRPAQGKSVHEHPPVQSNPSMSEQARQKLSHARSEQEERIDDLQLLLILACGCPIGSMAHQTGWRAIYAYECGEAIPAGTLETILRGLNTDLPRGHASPRPIVSPGQIIEGGLDLEIWRTTMRKLSERLQRTLSDDAISEQAREIGILQAQRMSSVLADMSQSWPYALINRELQQRMFFSDAGRAAVKANWMGELMEVEAQLAIACQADPVVQRMQEDYSLLASVQQRLAKAKMHWQQRLPFCTQKQDVLERIAQARRGVDLAELAQEALALKGRAERLPEGPERAQLTRRAEVLSAMAIDPGHTDGLWAQREWLLKCIGWAEACRKRREPALDQRSNLDRCQWPESGLDLIDTYGQFVADAEEERYAAERERVLSFTEGMRARREDWSAACMALEGQQGRWAQLSGELRRRPLSSAEFQQLYNLKSQIAAGRERLERERQAYGRQMRAEALRRGIAAGEVTLPQPEDGGAQAVEQEDRPEQKDRPEGKRVEQEDRPEGERVEQEDRPEQKDRPEGEVQ